MYRSLFLFSLLPLFAAEAPSLRLPESVRPTRYSVELTLAPGKEDFSGRIDIDLTITAPQPVIWLNAIGLNVAEARLGGQKAQVIPGNDQVIGVAPAAPVQPGKTTLRMIYSGKISRSSSAGIFQLEEDKRSYIFTQFEPTDARRAFPCFDEPGIKTPWEISLRVPRQFLAVSNYPQASESDAGGGMKLVRFAATRPLPAYLIAFGVGPFEIVDAGRAGRKPVPLRIIVPAGRKAEAQYAGQAISQLLPKLEDYFGIPYPYPKLDSLVMPIGNFAMENAGLITYAEETLLSRPDRDSLPRKKRCAVVAAHEMAHQWFGDLVTTAWWNDIWLNEAFATWLETKIVAQWKPEWHIEADAIETTLAAMESDSLVSARRIRQPIESYDDIGNAFDSITYLKGSAVIRMFENWAGPDNFRRGVQQYLKDFADRSATAPQFLSAVSQAAKRDVAAPFSTFLDQPGVPVLRVAVKCGENAAPAVELEQSRYLPLGSPGGESQSWQIPVCLRYESGGAVRTQCDLLAAPKQSVPLREASACPSWIMANASGAGYYRTNYDEGWLSKLANNGAGRLSLSERLSALGDLSPLVSSGDLAPAVALTYAQRYSGSRQREIVENTVDIAAMLREPFSPQDAAANARLYILSVFGERAAELGWIPQKGESDDDRLLRIRLVPFVARGSHMLTLIDEAQRLASAWLKDHAAVDPALVEPVLSTAAISGGRTYFDALVSALDREKEPLARQAIFHALGSFPDPDLAEAALKLLLSPKYDAREAFRPLLFGPLENRETRRAPFDFVQKNLDALLARLPREVGEDFAAALPGVGEAFCDAASRAEIEAFFKDKAGSYTGGPRRLAQVLESIDICIAKHEKIAPDIALFLRGFKM